MNALPLLHWQVRYPEGTMLWRAHPGAELYIYPDPSEAMIGYKWTGRDSLAFTASEKLFLPDPVITGQVATITITRDALEKATRVPRDPENDLDDLDYWPAGDLDISQSEFSTVVRSR